MKLMMSLLLAVFLIAEFSQVQAAPAPPEIPAYPGSQLVSEISISDEDILNLIKAAMQAFGSTARGAEGEIGLLIQALDLETLAGALSGVRQVRLMQFHMLPPANPADVLAFYEQAIGPGWNRIVWDVSQPGRGGALLVQPGLNEVIAIGVDPFKPAQVDNGEGEEVAFNPPVMQQLGVVRIVGRVNIEQLATWAGALVVRFSQIEEMKRREREAAEATAKAE